MATDPSIVVLLPMPISTDPYMAWRGTLDDDLFTRRGWLRNHGDFNGRRIVFDDHSLVLRGWHFDNSHRRRRGLQGNIKGDARQRELTRDDRLGRRCHDCNGRWRGNMTPVSWNEDCPVFDVGRNPLNVRLWRQHPMALHPDITVPLPVPVAGNPDMLGRWALNDHLCLGRRRLGLHHNLLDRCAVLNDHRFGLGRGRHLDIEINVQPGRRSPVGQQCNCREEQSKQASERQHTLISSGFHGLDGTIEKIPRSGFRQARTSSRSRKGSAVCGGS